VISRAARRDTDRVPSIRFCPRCARSARSPIPWRVRLAARHSGLISGRTHDRAEYRAYPAGVAPSRTPSRFRSGTQTTLRLMPDAPCPPAAPWCWTDTSRRSAAPMILPKVRDPRFVTIRRGGTLTDSDHHLLALWAASCAEHVLHLFESAQPDDPRPREAIEHARAWARGEVKMMQARAAGGHAMGAARNLRGAARHAAYAAGQAGAVAHVAAHELGAAAYAIKAARAAAPKGESDATGRLECQWQRGQLPAAVRELVLDDQRTRNDICWSVFDC
jgi:hypothetical protein